MQDSEMIEKINSFPRWHYQFNLNGYLTPIHDKTKINRHKERKKYFFDPVVKLLGGDLSGKRVLDLGCNAGFWSLQAIESGCEFVVGIDGRKMHIDQANLVFEAKNIESSRYQFIEADVFDVNYEELGEFDIVLYLGLMYHINKPIELMEKISIVNSDLLIIDTGISTIDGSYLSIHSENLDDPRNAIASELIFRPTSQAVLDIVRHFGYNVCMLEPNFKDYTGAEVYNTKQRRAFICSKISNIAGLGG